MNYTLLKIYWPTLACFASARFDHCRSILICSFLVYLDRKFTADTTTSNKYAKSGVSHYITVMCFCLFTLTKSRLTSALLTL